MTLREKINEQFNTALKSKNKTLVSTFRLILAAIKERDIANRSSGKKEEVQDAERVIFFQEDELAKSNGNLVQFIIQLYKAMGGGWENTEIATDKIVNEQVQE